MSLKERGESGRGGPANWCHGHMFSGASEGTGICPQARQQKTLCPDSGLGGPHLSPRGCSKAHTTALSPGTWGSAWPGGRESVPPLVGGLCWALGTPTREALASSSPQEPFVSTRGVLAARGWPRRGLASDPQGSFTLDSGVCLCPRTTLWHACCVTSPWCPGSRLARCWPSSLVPHLELAFLAGAPG